MIDYNSETLQEQILTQFLIVVVLDVMSEVLLTFMLLSRLY